MYTFIYSNKVLLQTSKSFFYYCVINTTLEYFIFYLYISLDTKLQFLLSRKGFATSVRGTLPFFLKSVFFFSRNIENKVSMTCRRQWRSWAPSISGERSSSGILYRCPLCPLASLDHSSPHSPSTILHSFWTLIPPVHSPLRPGTD